MAKKSIWVLTTALRVDQIGEEIVIDKPKINMSFNIKLFDLRFNGMLTNSYLILYKISPNFINRHMQALDLNDP